MPGFSSFSGNRKRLRRDPERRRRFSGNQVVKLNHAMWGKISMTPHTKHLSRRSWNEDNCAKSCFTLDLFVPSTGSIEGDPAATIAARQL